MDIFFDSSSSNEADNGLKEKLAAKAKPSAEFMTGLTAKQNDKKNNNVLF